MEEQRKLIDEGLDKFERRNGLAQPVLNTDVDAYLSMDMQQLQQLEADECGNAAYLLSVMAYNVQRAYNREMAIVTWTSRKLPLLLAGLTDSYPGKSYEERKMSAIREHANLAKLYSMQTQAQLKVDSLNFISNQIDKVSKMLLNLQMNKRGYRG